MLKEKMYSSALWLALSVSAVSSFADVDLHRQGVYDEGLMIGAEMAKNARAEAESQAQMLQDKKADALLYAEAVIAIQAVKQAELDANSKEPGRTVSIKKNH